MDGSQDDSKGCREQKGPLTNMAKAKGNNIAYHKCELRRYECRKQQNASCVNIALSINE